MASELNTFVTGPLWLKLKEDITGLRVITATDLFAAAYFHVRRLMVIRQGWTCHARYAPGQSVPELFILHRDEFKALLRFEFQVKPGTADWFPADQLGTLLTSLRRRLAEHETKHPGDAYLFGIFDTGEPWFYPDEEMWNNQSCFWVPVNCREFPNYSDWRARFDKLSRNAVFNL